MNDASSFLLLFFYINKYTGRRRKSSFAGVFIFVFKVIIFGPLLFRVEAAGGLVKVYKYIFLLGIVVKDDLVGLTADSGILISSERRSNRDLIIGIYPHTPGLNSS